MKKEQVLLCILDGWGEMQGGAGDALAQAALPIFQTLKKQALCTTLAASGLAVGLPAGQIGNSEVGHLNIGAGRVVYQDFTRITLAAEQGEFAANAVLGAACEAALASGGALHLMGLLSDGGVHSHLTHLRALLQLAQQKGLSRVYLHCFLDGRDVAPRSALTYLAQLQQICAELGVGEIATVMGRFYAMDRDNRWQRLERAWRALVLGEGALITDIAAAVAGSYAAGITDEFVEPQVVCGADGRPLATVNGGDAVIFYNFRADRARELSHAFVDSEFAHFDRVQVPKVHFCSLTQYDKELPIPVAFAPQHLTDTLGEVVARAGLQQLRLAETEKYAHVTFFFNGGVEQANVGEQRLLIPSPAVATYDLQPQMSAVAITDALLRAIGDGEADLIIVNFANPDMVGHTGNLAAAIKAVETVDSCLGRIMPAVFATGGKILIIADHGNVECMLDAAGRPMTAHTTNPVPCLLLGSGARGLREGGALCDVAPTLLELLGVEQPPAMSGQSLLIK